jgi:predicted RecB family endonuclease
MPVTAKLSKALYERLGEEIADQLVDWFNQLDVTSRNDLREFNEQNFSRFDSKLEQRISEVKSVLREEMAALRSEVKTEIEGVRTEIARLEARLEKRLGQMGADFIKWSFVFWAAAIAAIVGFR